VLGIAAELEALAIHKALAAVPVLPADTFLIVNVSPHLRGSAPVQDALATRPDLHRVVIEPTEHIPVHDLAALRRQTEELRSRGALIALDDAGSGYSGLQQLAALRPQVVDPLPAPLARSGSREEAVRRRPRSAEAAPRR
jgi:EAL domain-containing protein (putative c-di-GMP-specific phosphodiesterase class I)